MIPLTWQKLFELVLRHVMYVNAHLNYVTATGINVWNGDPEHVIDAIPILLNRILKISGIKLVILKMTGC